MSVLEVVGVLADLTRLYWVLGLLIYSAKFVSPTFDSITSYGKLVPAGKRSVPHFFAWRSFYVVGSACNAAVIAFECYLV